jgi:tRNA modification GTPase
MRHVDALKQCCNVLISAVNFLDGDISIEFISEDIKMGINFLDGITGRDVDADLIENIFSEFCIGK